jgi:hypothetical protein
VKIISITIFLLFTAHFVSAQTLDSIFFNLYTDSLKKGTYNYINVEGHFSDGTYLPLSNKELKFTSTGGKFSGNSLFIDSAFNDDKVTVKAVVIKKSPDNERLPTLDEVMHGPKKDTAEGIRKKRRKK